MKTELLVLLLAAPATALADTFVTMPDGGGCWVNNSGVASGCVDVYGHSVGKRNREAAKAEQMRQQNEANRQEQLRQCLRTADWPKMPGRDECMQMWGN
jgi:hypothetical protein